MRKTYIIWWAISAYCFFGGIYNIYDLVFFVDQTEKRGAVFILCMIFFVSLVTFFIGYRRFQEYKEYQEDRKIRNEYYKSNTKTEK